MIMWYNYLMQRSTIRAISLVGGAAAVLTAVAAFGAGDRGEQEPVFDPTRPAVVDDIYPRQVTAPELFSSRSEDYVRLEQCPPSGEQCATAEFRRASLDVDYGVVAVGNTVIVKTDD